MTEKLSNNGERRLCKEKFQDDERMKNTSGYRLYVFLHDRIVIRIKIDGRFPFTKGRQPGSHAKAKFPRGAVRPGNSRKKKSEKRKASSATDGRPCSRGAYPETQELARIEMRKSKTAGEGGGLWFRESRKEAIANSMG